MGDMRIMLVDDNGDLRRGMRDYLARQEGMKVVAECPSGAEALEALGKVRVDVMVLDLIMPQMDGFALMEEVRRQQLANPPQIIVVSALGRDDFIMRAVQLGARFYMVKPFDMASLAARIRESCGQGVVPLGTSAKASAFAFKLRKNGNYSCGLALRLLSFVICMTSRFIERCWSSSSWRKFRMRRSSASVRFVGMSSPAAGS